MTKKPGQIQRSFAIGTHNSIQLSLFALNILCKVVLIYIHTKIDRFATLPTRGSSEGSTGGSGGGSTTVGSGGGSGGSLPWDPQATNAANVLVLALVP